MRSVESNVPMDHGRRILFSQFSIQHLPRAVLLWAFQDAELYVGIEIVFYCTNSYVGYTARLIQTLYYMFV